MAARSAAPLATLLLLAGCGGGAPAAVTPPPAVLTSFPDLDWAGSYVIVGGAPTPELTLELSADGRFTWGAMPSCFGTAAAVCSGAVAADGDELRLRPGDWQGCPADELPEGVVFHDELVVVPWRRCVFLVPPEEMRDFCTSAAAAHHVDLASVYLCSDFFEEPSTGLPDVPPRYRDLLPAGAQDPSGAPAKAPAAERQC